MSLTSEMRRMRGRIGALTMHARNDTSVVSANGRKAADTKLNDRLLDEIDPDRSLPEAERERRLAYARKAHFQGLALTASCSMSPTPTVPGVLGRVRGRRVAPPRCDCLPAAHTIW